jgi:hypothetical protein
LLFEHSILELNRLSNSSRVFCLSSGCTSYFVFVTKALTMLQLHYPRGSSEALQGPTRSLHRLQCYLSPHHLKPREEAKSFGYAKSSSKSAPSFPVRVISRLGNDRAYNWCARTIIQSRASKRLDMIDDDRLFNLACGCQSTCHHTAARQRVFPWKAFLDLFTSRSLVPHFIPDNFLLLFTCYG